MKNLLLKKDYLLNKDMVSLILRIILGIIFIAHGSQKVFGLFGGYGLEGTAQWMNSQLGIPIILGYASSFVELFSGIGLFFGIVSRVLGVAISITMFVAIITAHLGSFFAPSGIEYPMTLLTMGVLIAITGSGKYSIDAKLFY